MKFCLYTSEQEENIIVRKQAKTWQRSGLITAEQLQTIESCTDPKVKQTNLFFRILFFIFTCLCAGAIVGFFLWLGSDYRDKWVAAVLMIFSVPCYYLAEHFIKQYSFYRHGIEEALSLMAVLLLCAGCGVLLDQWKIDNHLITISVCSLVAITACWIHWRFGFLYALLISIVALGIIPFQLHLSAMAERSLLVLILCLILFVSIIKDQKEVFDFQKEKNTIIQACLIAGIYLSINLRLSDIIRLYWEQRGVILQPYAGFPAYFYWISYALTFFIPIVGIYWGFRSRKRFIINISLIAAFLTLTTNKDYLGLKHNAWDPAIMGTMLILISVFATRWLGRGLNKRRHGFTAENILKPASHGINLADIGAALTPGLIASQQPAAPAAPADEYFAGGKSGGGGASRNY